MGTDEHKANAADVPVEDERIDDPESLLDLELDEEDEGEDDINIDYIDPEVVELQMSESESI